LVLYRLSRNLSITPKRPPGWRSESSPYSAQDGFKAKTAPGFLSSNFRFRRR